MSSRGQQAATGASAAVYVGRGRAGSAVLVTKELLLTARHVLAGTGHGGEVVVEFPGSRPGERLAARSLPPAELVSDGAPLPDVAVLELLDSPPWLPEPVEVWPARRAPARVQVFGFPREERDLVGVWREFDVAGPAAGSAAVQLRWREDTGTLPGHSGGAVLDLESGQVAGVLIEGSTHGRFDRYTPTHAAQQLWPQLPRPWLVIGSEGRDHFERRALGQRGGRGEEDLFRGRDAALDYARAWMLDDDPPGVPLVITGQPGAGKSAVLARTGLQELEAHGQGPGLAFHARDASQADLLDALGQLAGASQNSSFRDVLDALDLPGTERRRWLVAVDALDEAATDPHELARTLREIAALDAVRLVVATRQRHATHVGQRAAGSSLLGELVAEDDNLIDLDSNQYFDRQGLATYVEELLTQRGARGRAWSVYRSDSQLRRRLVEAITDRAGRNYLVAVMSADPLHQRSEIIDPANPEFEPTTIPSTVGDALARYLQSLPEGEKQMRRGALIALAYARGDGLDDYLWRQFANALGYPASQSALDALRSSAAADYLLQSTWQSAGGRRVWRLFHQALTDQLLDDPTLDRDRLADEAALVNLLQPLFGQARDAVTSAYISTHLAEHAAAGGILVQVLSDSKFVLHADLGRLLPLLRDRSVRDHGTAAVLRRAAARLTAAAGPPGRAQLIALGAAHLGYTELCAQYRFESKTARPRWAHSIGGEHMELIGHNDWVSDVAFGDLPPGQQILASAGRDRTVRLWDPDTGKAIATLFGHADSVNGVAFGYLPDGHTILASAGDDGTVRLWDPITRTLTATLHDHENCVRGVAFGQLSDGYPVLASAGDDHTVRLWDPATGTVTVTLSGHTGPVRSVAFGHRPGHKPTLASASDDRTVRLWDPESGAAIAILSGHTGPVWAVAFNHLYDGQTVLASASYDGTVRLWDPSHGACTAIGAKHIGPVRDVAFGRLADRRPVLVSSGDDRSVRLWDSTSGAAIATLFGHTNWVCGVAFGHLPDSQPVLASASDDYTVRLWEPAAASTTTQSDLDWMSDVDFGRLSDGRSVLSSACHDGTVRLWDPANGVGIATLSGHAGPVKCVTFGYLPGGRTVLASASRDETVRLWDPATATAIATLSGHTGEVRSVAIAHLFDERPILASAGDDHTVRLWDLTTGATTAVLSGHSAWVSALAFGHLPDGHLVLASASIDGDVRLWDPATATATAVLRGHAHWVRGLAFGRLATGRTLLASASDDHTVRLWDPTTGAAANSLRGHTGWVNDVEFQYLPDGRTVLASASEDDTVRLWDPATGTEQACIRFFGAVNALTLYDETVVAACSNALCAFTLRTTS